MDSSTKRMGIKTTTRKEERERKSSSASRLLARLLFVPGIVFDFSIDGDLHVQSTVALIWDDVALIVGIFTLRVKNTALAVTVNFSTLFANFTNGVGVVGVRVDVENGVGGVSVVRAGSPGGSCRRIRTRVGSRERSTSNERATDGENYAHSHGGSKDGSHAEWEFRVRAMTRVVDLTW